MSKKVIIGILTILFVVSGCSNTISEYDKDGNILDSKSYKINKANVVLITIDALRADHLGCYGYERNTSPNIDKFAEKEIRKMNSSKVSDQISAWSKPGIPATVYAVKKTADDKKKE